MKILGFNPSHHGSVCLLEDGELKFFIQEERVGNRIKYGKYPFNSFIDILQNHNVDHIAFGTPSLSYFACSNDLYSYWGRLFNSLNKNTPINQTYDSSKNSHHVTHCAHSFYNSGFNEAIGIVIDGVGSYIKDKENCRETETIFRCAYPTQFQPLLKNYFLNVFDNSKGFTINLSRLYETITMHLGWSRDEAGKTMGLSSYGKFNPSVPSFFKGNCGNPDMFFYDKDKTTSNPYHTETYLEKDLAWRIQNDTQQIVGDYIEKAIQETGLKQVCCAGGYFLNCVTNYYLLKRFPDIEFYIEPIANDSGTAIGAAKLLWQEQTQDTTIRPFKSLYLGKQYSKEELLKGIKKYT